MTAIAEPQFLDSNIWLYGLMPSKDFPEKSALASTIIRADGLSISLQVVNEVCSNLRRKGKFDESQILVVIDDLIARCNLVPMSPDTLRLASKLRSRYGFSFWDGIIVASALEAGADILYSEDMHDGLEVDSKLKIVNPFKLPKP